MATPQRCVAPLRHRLPAAGLRPERSGAAKRPASAVQQRRGRFRTLPAVAFVERNIGTDLRSAEHQQQALRQYARAGQDALPSLRNLRPGRAALRRMELAAERKTRDAPPALHVPHVASQRVRQAQRQNILR